MECSASSLFQLCLIRLGSVSQTGAMMPHSCNKCSPVYDGMTMLIDIYFFNKKILSYTFFIITKVHYFLRKYQCIKIVVEMQ